MKIGSVGENERLFGKESMRANLTLTKDLILNPIPGVKAVDSFTASLRTVPDPPAGEAEVIIARTVVKDAGAAGTVD